MGNHHPLTGRTWMYGLAGMGLLCTAGAHASGFALIEQSVSSMGTAYANGSAGMDDASTLFFNPATMTRLDGINMAGGVHVIAADTDFKGSAEYNPDIFPPPPASLGGVPIQGDSKTNTDLIQPVPHLGYSQQLNDRFWYGMTINAPFGLKTDYDDDDWVGRYHARKSELITVNINPSFGYRINELASVGAGVSALYADGELTNAVDGGLIGGVPTPPWIPGSTTFDGESKVTGNDWGYGFNLGLLLEPGDNTRIGLAYRSQVDLNLEGDFKLSSQGKQNAELDLKLPDSLSVSALHQFTPKLAVMADVTWTNWSKLGSLEVELQNGSTLITPLEWEDTYRFALGASYKFSESWLLRAGAAFDETPVPNKNLRTPRVPDEDRTWLTLGANYHYSKQLSFDFGYAHLFVDDPRVDTDDTYVQESGYTSGFHLLTGKYDSSVNMFSAQVNWKYK